MSPTMPIELDRSSPEPLYRQVAVSLRRAIDDGRLRPGQRVPSVRALADQLSVGRLTIATAYEGLAADGYLVGRVGFGTRRRARAAGGRRPRRAVRVAAAGPATPDRRPAARPSIAADRARRRGRGRGPPGGALEPSVRPAGLGGGGLGRWRARGRPGRRAGPRAAPPRRVQARGGARWRGDRGSRRRRAAAGSDRRPSPCDARRTMRARAGRDPVRRGDRVRGRRPAVARRRPAPRRRGPGRSPGPPGDAREWWRAGRGGRRRARAAGRSAPGPGGGRGRRADGPRPDRRDDAARSPPASPRLGNRDRRARSSRTAGSTISSFAPRPNRASRASTATVGSSTSARSRRSSTAVSGPRMPCCRLPSSSRSWPVSRRSIPGPRRSSSGRSPGSSPTASSIATSRGCDGPCSTARTRR